MNDLLFLTGNDVDSILSGADKHIMELIKQAYIAHHDGRAMLPPSSFLRFKNKERERIISLPAYLAEPFNCAGIKWISSFPDNVKNNIERASAIFILNSLETGHPLSVMESSIISAKRTAAGAAITADILINNKETVQSVAVLGCGLINFETVHYLKFLFPTINHITIVDIDHDRAVQFGEILQKKYVGLTISYNTDINCKMINADIISIATTAVTPHILKLDYLTKKSVILHTSLRDLAPEIMLEANNIVDDITHACSANTSLHLASQQYDPSSFISCTIAELLVNGKEKYIKTDRPSIVSPFGMGILDLALAQYIYQQATQNNLGITINNFIPEPWFKKSA